MEAMRTGGPLIVRGILQKAGEKNQNGRIYPYEVLKREVDKYIATVVKERRALGELDHPEQTVINLKNVSHNITEAHWEGKNLIGTIEILTTPSGNILRELFRNNIRLGISSRGLGSVKPLGRDESTVEVQDDFELICWDFVSTPSTHGAFVTPINESLHKKAGNFKQSSPAIENINRLVYDIISDIEKK